MSEAQQGLFDAKAESWDANPLFQRLTTAAAEALLQGGLLPPGAAVLELGSGTGLLADKLADHLDLFVGVDASPGMAGVFRRKIAARPDRKLHCLLGELPGALEAAGASGGQQQLPQAYDLALSHMTFHHIADVAGTLRMLRGLLKPGGRVAVFDLLKEPGSDKFHKPDHGGSVQHVGGFAPEEMTQLLQDAGYVDAETRAVADFQKESYQHPGQLNTFRLLMATAAVPAGA